MYRRQVQMNKQDAYAVKEGTSCVYGELTLNLYLQLTVMHLGSLWESALKARREAGL